MLLACAISQCAGQPRLTVLNTNTRAFRLYQRRGFRETGRTIPLRNGLYEMEIALEV